MISFSQLNEQMYVDRVLSEGFLSEDVTQRHVRSTQDQIDIDTKEELVLKLKNLS
jgi:hypothetical protein